MADSTPKPPKIQGAKEHDQETDEKAATETVMDQAIHMDLPTTPGVEVQPIQHDYVGLPVQEKLIEQTKTNNDNTIETNYSATKPKAKRAVKKKAEAAALEGTAGAQGTPIPDFWNQLLERQQKQHDQLILTLQDMRTYRAEAAPLQDQSTVPAGTKAVIQEDPNRPETMMTLQEHAVPDAIVIPGSDPLNMEPDAKRQRTFDKETDSYHTRFTKLFNQKYEHVNENMRRRLEPSMGLNPDTVKSAVYF